LQGILRKVYMTTPVRYESSTLLELSRRRQYTGQAEHLAPETPEELAKSERITEALLAVIANPDLDFLTLDSTIDMIVADGRITEDQSWKLRRAANPELGEYFDKMGATR